MSFGFNAPILDDSDSWAEASQAFQVGLSFAHLWQADARTALVDVGEYPPAHQNAQSNWEVLYWSPGLVKGLRLILDQTLNLVEQSEWGGFYLETAQRVGQEILGPEGFSFVLEIGQPGPDGLSFVFRRSAAIDEANEFVDIQLSTSVMLTPPPRRFTINLVRNEGLRPLFGANGGWEKRLGHILPQPQPDRWWSFKDETEYEGQLREALAAVISYGLPAMALPAPDA